MRMRNKSLYKDLIELARRDEDLQVRIIYYDKNIVSEVYLLDLCSDNVVAKGKRFYSSMHRIVLAAFENKAEIKVIDKRSY